MPTGKVSWFGGPHDSMDSGHTANGQTTATPGIAIYNRATLNGYWRVRFPNGRTLTLKQTDIGPHPSTGRKVDVTYSALRQAGYNEGNFPTDAPVQYSYLGKNPKGGGGGGGGGGAAPSPSAGTPQTVTQTTSQFDERGYKAAQGMQIVSQLIAKHRGTDNALFKSGVFSTAPVDPQTFTSLVSKQVPVAPAVSPARVSSRGGGGGAAPARMGSYSFQPGAGRQPKQRVQAGLRAISGTVGHALSVIDTTNHATYVQGTNTPSWHITGNAADISVGGRDTRTGDQIAAAALQYAGVPAAKARQMARQGGVWNLSHGGRTFQILWKTYVGGDHHNHVHFGVK